MQTQQPQWKFVANLGDANPIDHGGLFVFVDKTGIYDPECERLAPQGHNKYGEPTKWIVYRFDLSPCTYREGILSDNPFHPDCPAWFATAESEKANRPQDTTYLSNLAPLASAGCLPVTVDYLAACFCSSDPCMRAEAWRLVGDYHGWDNLDSYPLVFSDRAEVEKRYAENIGM